MTVLLATGSRHATQEQHGLAVANAFLDALNGAAPTLVIHGKAPGVDTIVNNMCRQFRWSVRGVRADWYAPCRPECTPGHRRSNHKGRDYCPAAGNYRNQQLVDIAAEHLPDVVCLAFPLPSSRGTWDCTRRAKVAGIEVVVRQLAVAARGAA